MSTSQIAGGDRVGSVRPAVSVPKAISDSRVDRWIAAIGVAIIFEGALRKWLLPASLNPVAFIAKDLIAVAFILSYPIPARERLARRVRDVFFFVALILLPAFIYGIRKDWQGAVIMYKNACLWGVFGTHLAPHLTGERIDRFLRRLAIVTMAIALLGLAQYRSSPSSFVNRYAWSTLGQAGQVSGFLSQGVRATGTFSFISGMSSFSTFAFVLFLWRFAQGAKGKDYWFLVLGTISAVCCGLTSGSRATSVVFAATLILTVCFADNIKPLLQISAILGIAALFFVFVFDMHVLSSFIERWKLNESVLARASGEGLKGSYFEIVSENPWGLGLGQQSNLAAFKEGAAQGTDVVFADHAGTRGVIEAGLLGWFAELVFQGAAVILFTRGILSKKYPHRLCTASAGFLCFYWLFECDWHDHNLTAMSGLLLALWIYSCKDLIKRRAAAESRFRKALVTTKYIVTEVQPQ